MKLQSEKLRALLVQTGDLSPWVNAAVAAGFAFFSTLAGINLAQIRADPGSALLAGSIASGLSFFTYLIKEFHT